MLTCASFALTRFYYVGFTALPGGIVVMSGGVHLMWNGPRPPTHFRWQVGRNLYRPSQWADQLDWWVRLEHYSGAYLIVPLWMPFVVLALVSAWLWWRDRRLFIAGQCRKCGYDLTGNVSGQCPECGTPLSVAR